MWFEMPENLNFPKFRTFFEMKGENAEIAKSLNGYLTRIKEQLGFGTKDEWKKLSQRPFPLNYEFSAKGKLVNKIDENLDSAIDKKVIAAIGAAMMAAQKNPAEASSAAKDGNEL
jgi:hypothetical protein